MCGIVGYMGNRPAKQILYEGLRRLEYRGYDSAGVCIISDDQALECVRTVGNLDALGGALAELSIPGDTGIGHTRWATHGAPTERNAHPHLDCNCDIAIVHNGIIENYAALRDELSERGHTLRSDTDSETLAHLIEEEYSGDLAAALRAALQKVEGSFAVVAVHREQPGVIVAARRDSPMCVGLADGECFIASGVPAFLSSTRTVVFLEDNDVAAVSGDGLLITGLDGVPIEREAVEVEWNLDAAEKGGFEDFMLKEIHEQPQAVTDTLRDKLSDDGDVVLEELERSLARVDHLRRVVVVACGTAYHAGLLGKYLLERWATLPVEVDIASEFRNRDLVVTDHDLVVAISQSGETMDTLAGVKEAKLLGAPVVGVCNTVGSLLTREVDGVIYTRAGPEIGVAATKTFTTQIAAMYLLALYLGRRRGTVDDGEYREMVAALKALPAQMDEVLAGSEALELIAAKYHTFEDFLFLGRGLGYPIAMEGALKLKEISYIHAEGYPAGEMKHGPIALLDPQVPVVALAPRDSVYEKMISNIQEVKARSAPVLAVATAGDDDIARVSDDVIYVPRVHEMLTPLVTVLPLQLLAYYIAKLRGCNVDQPRNLAKTVTVE